MGRPRREVLHDLGVRTGVDDVRSLAAILIQADRFGSSIAQALARAVRLDADATPATGRREGGEDGGPADLPAGAVHLPGDLRGAGRPGGDPDPEEPVERLVEFELKANPVEGQDAPGRFSRRSAMNRIIRAATAAALLTSGLGSIGCVHTGGPSLGDRYRNAVDPCYPDRYERAARASVVAPFAQQVANGQVMNQTIFNWYFTEGTDQLTPAGLQKLESLARRRPVPDPKIYLQTSRDLPANLDPTRIDAIRSDLDSKRAAVLMKYLASQPAYEQVAYEIYIHDPMVPGIMSELPANAYRSSFRYYTSRISGTGTGVLGTGGGGQGLFTPPVSGTGGGGGGGGAGAGGGGTGGGYTGSAE